MNRVKNVRNTDDLNELLNDAMKALWLDQINLSKAKEISTMADRFIKANAKLYESFKLTGRTKEVPKFYDVETVKVVKK